MIPMKLIILSIFVHLFEDKRNEIENIICIWEQILLKVLARLCIRGPKNNFGLKKLKNGKYKYHILKELLYNILQYTEIIDISYKNKLEIQTKIDDAIASAADVSVKRIN